MTCDNLFLFLDIDECKDDPGICQHNCTNTVGSFTCTCPPGYRLSRDKTTCIGIHQILTYFIKVVAKLVKYLPLNSEILYVDQTAWVMTMIPYI